MYKICYDIKNTFNVYGKDFQRVEVFLSDDYAEAIEFYKKNKRKYRLIDVYLYIYKDEFVLDKNTINECFEEGGE